MNKGDALRAIAVLNAGFPREALEGPSVELYAAEIVLLHDPDVALETARITVRNADRFPTVKDFRQTYRTLNEASNAGRELPEPPRDTKTPEWVHVWWWMRRTMGDDRVLPQQDLDGLAPAMSPQEYELVRVGWVGAGSPTINMARLAAMAARA